MSKTTLKESLGEAAAFIDDSHGEPRLLTVLKALASGGNPLDAEQATVATDVIGTKVVSAPAYLTGLRIRVGTTGTAGSTTVQARLNGVGQGSGVTVANTDADGTSVAEVFDPPVELVAGDLVEIEVTAAPTAGADLTASAQIQNVITE